MAPTKRKSRSPSKKPPAKRNTSTATPDKTSTASAAASGNESLLNLDPSVIQKIRVNDEEIDFVDICLGKHNSDDNDEDKDANDCNTFDFSKVLWAPQLFVVVLTLQKSFKVIKTLREFKRQIAEALCGFAQTNNTVQKNNSSIDNSGGKGGDDGGDHTIAKLQMTEKGARGHRDCKLCRIGETRLGKNGKTKRYSCCYECTTCQAGFHIECFIVYHNIDNYPEVKKHLGAKKVAEIKESLKRNDKCKFVKDSKFSSDCGLQLRFMV